MSGKFVIDPAYDPDSWSLGHGAGPDTADRKFAPASELYPNLSDYARVDAERFTSPEVMRQEWSRLWTRTWTCAGRTSDLPVPGSFFRYDLGSESLIVTRGRDGEIRALYNACQHRGRQLVDVDYGTKIQLVCPFHSWTYDLAGKNIRVTDRETFSGRALCGDLNLKQARCEIWAGFVFINMDPAAKPLMDFLSDLPELMAAYKMEDMHVVKETVLEVECNWKIGLEAFLESYHLHITHPQALPLVDDVYEQFDAFPNGHSRLATPLAVTSPRLGKRTGLSALQEFFLAESGIDPQTYSGPPEDAPKAIRAVKRRADNKFGLDYSGFTDSQITDDWNYFVYPNVTFNSHPEGILVMRFLPHATDPGRHYYHVHVIMPKLRDGCKAPFYMGVDEGTDISGATRPAKVYSTIENPQIGEVLEQDLSNMAGVQRGLKSKGFPGGMRYAEREGRLQILHAENDLYLQGFK